MREEQFKRLKYGLILLVTLLAGAQIAWEYNHGGVLSHYLLHRKDMPSISNWWSLAILPVLALVCLQLAKSRLLGPAIQDAQTALSSRGVYAAFFGMLLVSITQAMAFQLGFEQITKYLAITVLLSGLFLPIYRAEYVLGNVLGAAFTFGAVIPVIGMLVMGTVSVIAHKLLKPLLFKLLGAKSPSAP